MGSEFEADIRPCSSSSNNLRSYEDGSLLDADLQEIFEKTSTVHMTIEDSKGKKYFEKDITVLAIDNQQFFKDLASGIYWMKVENKEASVYNKILVVND